MGIWKKPEHSKKDDIYYCTVYVNGKQYNRSTKTNVKKDALLFEKELLKELKATSSKGDVVPSIKKEEVVVKKLLVSEAWEQYKRAKLSDKKEINIRKYDVKINKFINVMGDIPIKSVTSQTIRNYIDRLMIEKFTPGSVNAYLCFISSILKYNEVDVTVNKLSYKQSKDFIMSKEQEDQFFEALMSKKNWSRKQEMYDIFKVCLYTGMRISEILTLDKSTIELTKKQFIILPVHNKVVTDKDKVLPMSDRVYEIMVKYPDGFNFGYSLLHRYFCIIRKRCVRLYDFSEKFTIHSFRHTFATRLIDAGITINKVSKLLGHLNVKTTQRYTNDTVDNAHDMVNMI